MERLVSWTAWLSISVTIRSYSWRSATASSPAAATAGAAGANAFNASTSCAVRSGGTTSSIFLANPSTASQVASLSPTFKRLGSRPPAPISNRTRPTASRATGPASRWVTKTATPPEPRQASPRATAQALHQPLIVTVNGRIAGVESCPRSSGILSRYRSCRPLAIMDVTSPRQYPVAPVRPPGGTRLVAVRYGTTDTPNEENFMVGAGLAGRPENRVCTWPPAPSAPAPSPCWLRVPRPHRNAERTVNEPA